MDSAADRYTSLSKKPMVRELTSAEATLIFGHLAASGDLEAGEILQKLLTANPVPSC